MHLKAFILCNQNWVFAGIPKAILNEFPKVEQHDLQPLQQIPKRIKNLLLTISSATIERLLKPVKEQYRLKRRYRPHPRASVLKKQIPVEPHYNKLFGRIGYNETDTVHLSGGDARGDYCLALGDIDKTVPFVVHTRHPDGGVELINEAILAYAREHGIRYVRSRPYHKNDNAP